jgi:hypothetical protein
MPQLPLGRALRRLCQRLRLVPRLQACLGLLQLLSMPDLQ